jgi:hypothetical protein
MTAAVWCVLIDRRAWIAVQESVARRREFLCAAARWKWKWNCTRCGDSFPRDCQVFRLAFRLCGFFMSIQFNYHEPIISLLEYNIRDHGAQTMPTVSSICSDVFSTYCVITAVEIHPCITVQVDVADVVTSVPPLVLYCDTVHGTR